MSRVYNFSAGPAVLPVEVLKEAQEEMLDYRGCGMSVMEMSHRSAAIAAVPMSAAITAVDIKPIRIRICSTNVLLESFKIIFTDSNRFHSPSFIIYGILRKESFRNSDITLIVHPTTVPSTVASAAPRIPSLGKPR